MSKTLFFYVARLYVVIVLGILGALTVVYAVVDFGDRLSVFIDHPAREVMGLYGFKSLVYIYQLAPAAILLAAGMTVSVFRRRSEWVAMQAVGASRAVIVLPIAVSALLFAGALTVFDELVVTNSGTRIDQIMANSFNRWGNYGAYYFPKQWFRVGPNVFQVRGQTDEDGTIHAVSVFTMSPSFHLDSRIDADEMRNVDGASWSLHNAVSRQFLPNGDSSRTVDAQRVVTFEGTTRDTFRVRIGKPEFMRVRDLIAQQEIRSKVGLPTQEYWLALHNRFAYPMTGFGAAMDSDSGRCG